MKKLEDMTEPEIAEMMKAIARGIQASAEFFMEDKPRFALVLFNDPKVGQYIGNCTRASIIEALRETADRLERNQVVER